MAAELLDNGRDFARGNTLNIHFGQGEFKCLFTADALFEGAGIEVEVTANLGNIELDRPQAGGEGFGFKAVGVALTSVGALVGLGLQGLSAFLGHRLVDEQAETFGQAGGAFFSQ